MSNNHLYPLVIGGLLLFGLTLLWLAPDRHVVVPAMDGPVCAAPEPTGTQ